MRLKVKDAIKHVISREMERDPLVYLIGEEVGVCGGPYQCSSGLLEAFGSARVVDTPISEIGFTGCAVGSAFCGLKPICEFMSWSFSLQALDHLVNSAAKTLYMSGGQIKCPIVFRGPNGFVPGLGAQHTNDLSGYFCSVPGLKVVAPHSVKEHIGLIRSAIRDQNPVIVLENEVLYLKEEECDEEVLGDEFSLPLDRALVVREGSEVTLVGVSLSVELCLGAAKILNEQNTSVEVLSMVAINPLDIDGVERSVRRTGRVVVVEYGWPECGIGSEIAAQIGKRAFSGLLCPVVTISGKKVPTPYAKEIEEFAVPTVDGVVNEINKMMGRMEYKKSKDLQ